MGARQREWAKRKRAELVALLGGACVLCGNTDKLEVDHEDGRMWVVREFDSSTRISRYWREFREGVRLRVLCQKCNGTLGGSLRYPPDVERSLAAVPF